MTQEQLIVIAQLVQLGLQKLSDDTRATLDEAATLIPAPDPEKPAKPVEPTNGDDTQSG